MILGPGAEASASISYHADVYRLNVIKMTQVTFKSNVKQVEVKARSILYNDVLPAKEKRLCLGMPVAGHISF
jgi:hypothetical protein